MAIMIQGAFRGSVSTEAGKTIEVTYVAQVTDGFLTVGAGQVEPGARRAGHHADHGTAPAVGSGYSQGGLFYFAIQDLDTGFVMRSSITIQPGERALPRGGLPLAQHPLSRVGVPALDRPDRRVRVRHPALGRDLRHARDRPGPSNAPDTDTTA